MNDLSHDSQCQPEQVAAYLDGELSDVSLENFEGHLKACAACKTELRTQQQLLCTLNAAFGSRSFELPSNFTRIVKVHAESDMSGMRKQGERRRAFQVAAILALVSFALLGTASGGLVFQPARSILRIIGSLFELVWWTIYDAGAGLAVILRLSGRAIILNPHGLGLLLLLAFLLAISLLPLLIVKYHRAQTIE
ncbi:MAG TPA: zf-HC2 domain-containing protein [Candidatus Udaeobacter sp.]